MGKDSRISWTDHTFNPWEGCTMVSLGCAHCYAATRNARFNGGTALNWGKGAPRRRTSAANWKEPLKWNKQAGADELAAKAILDDEKAGEENLAWAKAWHRPRVFCASLADWLDDEVPIEWLADLLKLIRLTPRLDWQLLTKRPQNWEGRLREVFRQWRIGTRASAEESVTSTAAWVSDWLAGQPPANVWIGTTVEDQARADERIPLLLSIPAKVRFLSCEPLLGPVDLTKCGDDARNGTSHFCAVANSVHWVICGGESGPGARSMNLMWARELSLQCSYAGVPFFMKQLGASPVYAEGGAYPITDKKGDIMAEWPAALRVQEFPEVDHV